MPYRSHFSPFGIGLFWAGGMTGFGTGMFLAGVDELQGFYLQRAEIIGWGGGIVLGTISAIFLFIGPL